MTGLEAQCVEEAPSVLHDRADYPIAVVGRRVALAPVTAADLVALFSWRVDCRYLHLWSAQGHVPTYGQFLEEMDHLAQDHHHVHLMIRRRNGRRAIGHVWSYDADLRAGHAKLGVFADPGASGLAMGAEATILFVDYLMKYYSLRKLYAEVVGWNRLSLATCLRGGFVEEGILRRHRWHEDDHWDLHILALWRETWDSQKPRLLRWARGKEL
jgi:RimJ/RimL family protein N-acetyltransferase